MTKAPLLQPRRAALGLTVALLQLAGIPLGAPLVLDTGLALLSRLPPRAPPSQSPVSSRFSLCLAISITCWWSMTTTPS